jgi:glycosyltransferase involved in cell wall biosynthesis
MLSPLKPFNKFALKNLSKAIGVSEFVGKELRAIFPNEKVVVIPNGLDLENVRRGLREEFRKLHGLPMDAPVVGTLGELREAKGQRDFVLAAAEITKRFPNCHFVITGLDHSFDRSFRRELKRLVGVLGMNERFLWLDWLDDTAPFYSGIDVFVSPSHAESFGLAILEAMARGTRVVATDTPGGRELLGDEARLVKVMEPVELADAICEMLDRPQDDSFCDLLRQRAGEKYSLARMLDETERIYREVTGRES